MKSSKEVPQHKRMAMGEGKVGFKSGGAVSSPLRSTGMPQSPLTAAKRRNGVPGMKGGGAC